MATTWRTRIQAGLAIALFFGSLGTLLYNVYSATALPQRELQVRHILQQATHLMATQADPVLQTVFLQNGAKSEEFHRALVPITSQVLQKFSGLEAGSVVSVWGYTAGFVVLSALAASAFSLFASTMPETSRAKAIDSSTTRQLARRQVEFA